MRVKLIFVVKATEWIVFYDSHCDVQNLLGHQDITMPSATPICPTPDSKRT